ncbi:MAG: glycosyltransferase family 2 protein [Chitinophagaceae bacterium]|nr:glycosyltransferase family 2 protein [Chitinophagaceae bacterium]
MNEKKISIIIPTCNREHILEETVAKALDAIREKSAEIIVVNDGDKPTILPDIFSGKIKILENNKGGVSRARNLGAAQAAGQVLFFVDDDMWINKEIIDWIETNLTDNKEEDAVYNVNWEYPPELNNELKESKIGRFLLSNGYNTMWGRMKQKAVKPISGLYLFDTIGSCSFIISKQTFEKIGGYKDSITFQGEDIELSIRLNHLKIPIYCLFDITLFHNHRDRIDINNYLNRIRDGYNSQFMAERKGLLPRSGYSYQKNKLELSIYNMLSAPEVCSMWLLKILPNNKIFDPVSNSIIGLLSGIIKFKQWKNAFAV